MIDNELRSLLRHLSDIESELPISSSSQEFGDGLVCYLADPGGKWYEAALPLNAPIRLIMPINDTELRPLMSEAMKATVEVLQYIAAHPDTLPPPISDVYRTLRFSARGLEDAYYQFVHMSAIRSSRLRLGPCDHPQMVAPLLSGEGLLPLKEFEQKGEYFVLKDGSAAFLPCFPTRDCRTRILELLSAKGGQCDVYIAPVEYVDVSGISDVEVVTEAQIFGAQFSESLFKQLLETQGAAYSYDQMPTREKSMVTPMYELQYKVAPQSATEASLLVEEVIDVTFSPESRLNKFIFRQGDAIYVRDRLIHAIYDKSKSCFTHLDLSFLYFELTDESYWRRIKTSIWKSTVSASEKMKVFRIDGMLSFEDGCNLMGAGLDGGRNPEVANLLKCVQPRMNERPVTKTDIEVI